MPTLTCNVEQISYKVSDEEVLEGKCLVCGTTDIVVTPDE